MWRKLGDQEQTVAVFAGVSITIPAGTRFQFRSDGDEPLEAVAMTMPPWPGANEALAVAGPWKPTVYAGSLAGPIGNLQIPDRPNLDATQPDRRDLRRQLDGRIQVARFDQEEARQLLLGLREWPVGR